MVTWGQCEPRAGRAQSGQRGVYMERQWATSWGSSPTWAGFQRMAMVPDCSVTQGPGPPWLLSPSGPQVLWTPSGRPLETTVGVEPDPASLKGSPVSPGLQWANALSKREDSADHYLETQNPAFSPTRVWKVYTNSVLVSHPLTLMTRNRTMT